MSIKHFDEAMAFLFLYEGGYVNNPRDPGGETNLGISKRRFPGEDIKGMTKQRATELYLEHYWDKNQCSTLPPHIAIVVFDTAVNGGAPIRWLQEAVKSTPDGVIGPKTIAAANAAPDKNRVVSHILAYRIRYLTSLSGWDDFGLGWTRRVTALALLRPS